LRVGVDVQVVAEGNRSGLYTCLRSTVRALRPLVRDDLWLFAERRGAAKLANTESVSSVMDGAKVRLLPRNRLMRRAYTRTPAWTSLDVFLHNLHGGLPRSRRAANVYLVPDVIPLAVDYGVPGFVNAYRPFYEEAVRYGDAILVFSEHAKHDLLSRMGGNPELVHVAPLAAGPEFRPTSDSVLRSALGPVGLADQPYVLMVATIERRKNHAVLLRAFAKMIRREPGLPHKLVFVGGKWIGHEDVFDLIRELALGDRVVYLGFADQLPALYAGSDAFVFPSRYEGFGLPVLEAMACGVPVIAADATSLPEVVGDAGVLFDPDDVEGLADALEHVITDRAYHDRLGAQGLRRAAEFSWEETARRYLAAFEAGIQRRRQGRPIDRLPRLTPHAY
jgi:glycosyltransferase involved in cell wall biosynthesis